MEERKERDEHRKREIERETHTHRHRESDRIDILKVRRENARLYFSYRHTFQ